MATVITLPDFRAATRPVEGKFVQLAWRGNNYLLFAAASQHKYHNQMVAQFLGRHGIRHRWIGGDRMEWDDATLQVHGGGRFRLDPAAQSLSLWDRSTAYGRFDEVAVRSQLAAEDSPWRGWLLHIDQQPV